MAIATQQTEHLLNKLNNIGTTLNEYVNIHTGVTLGRVKAFIIGNEKFEQIISQNPNSKDILIPFVYKPIKIKWSIGSKYIIWISSSRHKQWPWSNIDDESTAEEIFAQTFPIISQHLFKNKDSLKSRSIRNMGKFYWELSLWEPKPENYPHIYKPKIIYPLNGNSLRASYDASNGYIFSSYYHIPTDNLTILAVMNSSLINWYAKKKFKKYPNNPNLIFTMDHIRSIPIIPLTDKISQKITDIVNQILNEPENPNLHKLEEQINQIIYDLYDLTPAEISLIEEESSK